MPINVGDALPQVTFTVMTADGPQPRTTSEVFSGRRVALVGVPGAFTPTCTLNHVPGFVAKAAELRDKGIDLIAVTSVNDVFVMNAWAKSLGADQEGFVFLADGSAVFAKALGLTLDLADRGLGQRSQRYAMLVDDGVVTKLNIEPASGKADVSSAEALLEQL
jgi:glutaredoxin/glutathione-dependent peroxiredoxin